MMMIVSMRVHAPQRRRRRQVQHLRRWLVVNVAQTFASPKMTYVSDAGLLKMSGCVTTNRMFFALRIVTRDTPVIGRSPKT